MSNEVVREYPAPYWVGLAVLGISVLFSLLFAIGAWLTGTTVPMAGNGASVIPPLIAGHYLGRRHGGYLRTGYRWAVSLWSVGVQVLGVGLFFAVGMALEGLNPLVLLQMPGVMPDFAIVAAITLPIATGITWLMFYLGERMAVKAAERAQERELLRGR